MAKRYRKYRALYDFKARENSELSISYGETLTVAQLRDGSWPSPEKWMQGYNEVTQQKGEFPGGEYVQFIREFVIEPEPPPPPLPQPSPRHNHSQRDFQSPGMISGSQSSDTDNSTSYRDDSPQIAPAPDNLEEAPPIPPPRTGSISQTPRPRPRTRTQHSKNAHNWMTVTFGLPTECRACELTDGRLLIHGHRKQETPEGHQYLTVLKKLIFGCQIKT